MEKIRVDERWFRPAGLIVGTRERTSFLCDGVTVVVPGELLRKKFIWPHVSFAVPEGMEASAAGRTPPYSNEK